MARTKRGNFPSQISVLEFRSQQRPPNLSHLETSSVCPGSVCSCSHFCPVSHVSFIFIGPAYPVACSVAFVALPCCRCCMLCTCLVLSYFFIFSARSVRQPAIRRIITFLRAFLYLLSVSCRCGNRRICFQMDDLFSYTERITTTTTTTTIAVYDHTYTYICLYRM